LMYQHNKMKKNETLAPLGMMCRVQVSGFGWRPWAVTKKTKSWVVLMQVRVFMFSCFFGGSCVQNVFTRCDRRKTQNKPWIAHMLMEARRLVNKPSACAPILLEFKNSCAYATYRVMCEQTDKPTLLFTCFNRAPIQMPPQSLKSIKDKFTRLALLGRSPVQPVCVPCIVKLYKKYVSFYSGGSPVPVSFLGFTFKTSILCHNIANCIHMVKRVLTSYVT
jgi:hypothetical protein